MEFEVQITETLIKTIKIKAENKEEACKIAKSAYDKSDIILSADDFCDVEFNAISIDEPKTKI